MPVETRSYPARGRGRFTTLALTVVNLSFLFFSSDVTAAEKLRVSNCYIGGAILPLWMAQDAGLYGREGLDVKQIWVQGNPAVAALISGEIDLLYCIPHNVTKGLQQ
jgi:ABC-type nitrate/sulfonate/bicarbonate transport system substrate-binding protein